MEIWNILVNPSLVKIGLWSEPIGSLVPVLFGAGTNVPVPTARTPARAWLVLVSVKMESLVLLVIPTGTKGCAAGHRQSEAGAR
jgi:hypothetical protein